MTLAVYEPLVVPAIWLNVTEAVSEAIKAPAGSSEHPEFVPEPVWLGVGNISVAALMTMPTPDHAAPRSSLNAVISIDPSEAIARDKNFAAAWRGTYKSVADGDNFLRWRVLFGGSPHVPITLPRVVRPRQRIAVVRHDAAPVS